MLLQFRMYTDENDLFLRDFRVPGKWTLLEFHAFLTRELNYRPDPAATFFRSDDTWEWGEELALDENSAQAQTRIGLLARESPKLIYCFDREEERFMYLEMNGLDAGDGEGEVIFANGDAPRQSGSGGARSIYGDAMKEFDDFDGDDNYDDE